MPHLAAKLAASAQCPTATFIPEDTREKLMKALAIINEFTAATPKAPRKKKAAT